MGITGLILCAVIGLSFGALIAENIVEGRFGSAAIGTTGLVCFLAYTFTRL